MQVRTVQQVLPPGVAHAREADLCAGMGRVGGDGAQGFGRGTAQAVAGRRLVLEGDDGGLVRHGEDDMGVWGVEAAVAEQRRPALTVRATAGDDARTARHIAGMHAVWGERFRICMSSVMRWRSGVIDGSCSG